VRCWEPTDAEALKEAVDASIDHLLPWMPWAGNEPQTVEEKVELLRDFRGRFDLDQDYVYAIFSRDESKALGGTGLHKRHGELAFEIGYWIRASHAGKGLATEASGALTKVAFELCDVDRVEIRVEPVNERSRRVPLKLGYREEAILRRRLPMGDEPRDAVIYSIFRDEYEGSPCAAVEVEAYNALGRRFPFGSS
jgi:RimJ/RimL family protein N-acetyltransferase